MILASRRRSHRAIAVALAAALSWMVAASTGTPSAAPALTAKIIVQGTASAESAVREMGGRITHDLPLIGGFSAEVPAANVPDIANLPGVINVTPDEPTHVQGAITTASVPGSTNTIPSVYKKVTRCDALSSAGYRGQGVTVALIDTGVADLADLRSSIQRVSGDALGLTTAACVNLTSEPTCDDSYGHGTFMAGLMVGNGAASLGKYVGMAPSAKVISLKIAGANGSSDVSTIIAALQWVVAHKDEYGIKVINLSLGTDSTQSYHADPFNYAVEQAWFSGLVVNVAASNRGPDAGTISKPADDPFVITVGSVDDKGTAGLGDDVLPDYSGRGPTAADGLVKPDVAAPGSHVVSLAAPGSSISTQFPSTMAAPYRRGSGTSMATAVVSGLVAQMLSAQPSASPDRIKYELMSTARHAPSNDPNLVGEGTVDGYGALSAGAGLANQGVEPGLGTGSLAASRGTTGVVLDNGADTILNADSGDLTALVTTDGTSWWGTSWWEAITEGTSWWGTSWWESVTSGTSWWSGATSGTSWWGTSWWESQMDGTSWWEYETTGTSWWGASMDGTHSTTEDYGTSWWGGAYYGAWDQ
jgi:serine protease AprX